MGLKRTPSRRSNRSNPKNPGTKNLQDAADSDQPDLPGASPATASEDVAAMEIDVSPVLPLEVGTHILCRWRDGQFHPVKIIERRKLQDGGPTDYEYYVHYVQFNRRLDGWVKLDQLDLNSLQPSGVENLGFKETSSRMTRYQKRMSTEMHEEELGALHPAVLQEHEEVTKVKSVEHIQLGKFQIETWYFSPFPPEYKDCPMLYFCEFCLNFYKREDQLQRHKGKCDLKHPPGNEIYRSGPLSMFEVNGRKNIVYSENLCLLAKLFLDHKVLSSQVGEFLFYVLCECDDRGCHIVAYFSKEKFPEESFNLSCILTLPPYQRKGYGNFLIAFSYELSKKEGKVGTPERPLSDLGTRSYLGYWTRVIVNILKEKKRNISIEELSAMTSIRAEDVQYTLKHLELLKYRNGEQYIRRDAHVLDRLIKAARRPSLDVDVSKLIWTPFYEKLI